jgi:hypothetical protein
MLYFRITGLLRAATVAGAFNDESLAPLREKTNDPHFLLHFLRTLKALTGEDFMQPSAESALGRLISALNALAPSGNTKVAKLPPLTDDERIVYDAIPLHPKALIGKAIVKAVASEIPGIDEARISRICTRTLKAYGVKNRHGAGYYRIGASQVVLSERIKEIEMKGEVQTPTVAPAPGTTKRRFAVAFTFPGMKRRYVQKVDKALQILLRPEQIFYDGRYEHELARPDLDTYLQEIYHDQAELIVAFLCSEYRGKEWCGVEWSAIRDIIKKRQGDSVMPFRFDNAEIPGLFSKDGYIDATAKTPGEAADLIHKRLLHNRGQAPRTASAVCEVPRAGLDPAAASEVVTNSPPKLKDQIRKFLEDTNPEILRRVRSGQRQVCVMFAIHRLSELHNLLGTANAKEFVTCISNGSVSIGIGNRVGTCINDLCEGDKWGFNLDFVGDW